MTLGTLGNFPNSKIKKQTTQFDLVNQNIILPTSADSDGLIVYSCDDQTKLTVSRGITTNISSITAGTNGFIPSNGSFNQYSVEFKGYFKPDIPGTWTFYTESDDASYLYINGQTVSNGGTHSMNKRSID